MNFQNKMGQTTIFTPAQVHLLQMFELDNSQQGLDELKRVLYQYYSSKMKSKLDQLWDDGILDQQKLDEINTMDLHNIN